MNQARRAFPLQDDEAAGFGLCREFRVVPRSFRPSLCSGGRFLRRGKHERETDILHHNADLLSQ